MNNLKETSLDQLSNLAAGAGVTMLLTATTVGDAKFLLGISVVGVGIALGVLKYFTRK